MRTKASSGSGGGGGIRNQLGIAHKQTDASTLYTSIITPEETNSGMLKYEWDSTTEQSHSTGTYGGTFDFTRSIDSNTSVRLYSMAGTNLYLLMDVIKNGVTVENGVQIPLNTNTNLTYSYCVFVGI